jgi:hypothetical protein
MYEASLGSNEVAVFFHCTVHEDAKIMCVKLLEPVNKLPYCPTKKMPKVNNSTA